MMPALVRLSLVAVLIAACAETACAHRVNGGVAAAYELRGAVVAVSADRIRVRHKTGQIVELLVDEQMQVLRNDKPETRAVLREGIRVRVMVEPMGGGIERAKIVRVYGS